MNLTEQLTAIQHDLGHLHSEITLAIGALLTLGTSFFKVPNWLSKLIFFLVLCYAFWHWPRDVNMLFFETLSVNKYTGPIGKVMLFSATLILLFGNRKYQQPTYYFLLLSLLLGAFILIQSNHFLNLYLSLELISYCSYILSNFTLKKQGHEAGLKYLIFGGVSSASMLFGISILYGTSGSLFITEISTSSIEIVGAIMFFAGLLFKVGLAPFHFWIPNVYESSPIDFVAFLSVVPKLAGLLVLERCLQIMGWGTEFILILGIGTLILGALGAIGQKNVRRLISYGAIVHTGFMLPFVVLRLPELSMVFYGFIYSLGSFGIFCVVEGLEKKRIYTLLDSKGFGRSNVIFAVSILPILVALIGLPPTAGFTAKWMMFTGVWKVFQINNSVIIGFYFFLGILLTVLSLFYYLRIPYYQFLKSADKEQSIPKRSAVIPSIISFLLLLFFIFPEWVCVLFC